MAGARHGSWTRESPVGRPGRLVVGTRGERGPGEVEVDIRGGTELFIASSPLALPTGTEVVCVSALGPRTVLVMPWADPRDPQVLANQFGTQEG